MATDPRCQPEAYVRERGGTKLYRVLAVDPHGVSQAYHRVWLENVVATESDEGVPVYEKMWRSYTVVTKDFVLVLGAGEADTSYEEEWDEKLWPAAKDAAKQLADTPRVAVS